MSNNQFNTKTGRENDMEYFNIAIIDGPAGAQKQLIAKLAAKALACIWIREPCTRSMGSVFYQAVCIMRMRRL